MEKSNYNNVILISGSGRNSGKTTVACHIISQLARKGNVIGLKISPHFHASGVGQELVISNPRYHIYREHDANTGKDSSRMLSAGASVVYFIQCTDENLEFIEEDFRKIVSPDVPIVCESGSFSNVFNPGFQLLVIGENPDKTKVSFLSNIEKSDQKINRDDFSQDWFSYMIDFESKRGYTLAVIDDK